MSTMDSIDIDVLETTLDLLPSSVPEDQLYRMYSKIIKLVEKKDKMINEKNMILSRQDTVIKRQLEEICLLHHGLESYNYYPKHPKDSYMIDFGYPKWRKMSYRMCISTREGEKLIKWVEKRKSSNDNVDRFKQYLIDVNYENQ